MYRMFFVGVNFVSSHICILKSKKPKKPKNLKTFSKKPRFFPALTKNNCIRYAHVTNIDYVILLLYYFTPQNFHGSTVPSAISATAGFLVSSLSSQ